MIFRRRPRWSGWLFAIMSAAFLLNLKYEFFGRIGALLWLVGVFVLAAGALLESDKE